MFEDLFVESGLSFERLNALVQLSEYGSLIKAAKGDTGLQSRYSHHLREMSEYFGTELTLRAGRTIRLTPAGQQLARLAREQFRALLQLRQQMRNEPYLFQLGAGDSLLQWLVVPAIGTLRGPNRPMRMVLRNLRTNDIVSRLQEQRLDFGLLRKDAVPGGLTCERVCTVKYAVVVPERLVAGGGSLSLRKALFECPHAALESDGQMTQRVQEIARQLRGEFRPELMCDSLTQCVAAVQSGYYASLLPVPFWTPRSEMRCRIIEDPLLDLLDRDVVLAWHPRLIDVHGAAMVRFKGALLGALRAKVAAEN